MFDRIRCSIAERGTSWHALILLLAVQVLSSIAARILTLKDALGPDLAGRLPLAWAMMQVFLLSLGLLCWLFDWRVALRRALLLTLVIYTLSLGLNVVGLVLSLGHQ